MITREEILKGRERQHPLDEALEANLKALLIALNKFRYIYGTPMRVTSGYRPAAINLAIGGSKKSAHMSCQAADFADADGKLKMFCLQNVKVLEDCGLYVEDPASTPTWCHMQIRPTKNRIFKP
jgi:hypothetical protein